MNSLITAAEAECAQARVAGELTELQPGDRLALIVPGSPQLITAALGALRVGVIPVVLDPATPAAELSALLADADAAMVIDTPAALAGLHAGEPTELGDVPLGRPMHYTSGTTGRRKGVWSGVLDADAALQLWGEECEL